MNILVACAVTKEHKRRIMAAARDNEVIFVTAVYRALPLLSTSMSLPVSILLSVILRRPYCGMHDS